MRHGVTVHTVVVYLHGGPAGLDEQEYEPGSLGRKPWTFRYTTLGLSGALATEYLARPEPLAWALAVLMKPTGFNSRAELAVACLRRILEEPGLDDARRHLLLNCVRTYVQSDKATAPEYDELLREADHQEVQEMMTTWADEVKAKGHEEGLQKGRQEGMQEGMQDLVVRLLADRFGRISEGIRRRVKAITSSEELTRLAVSVTRAGSLKELGLV